MIILYTKSRIGVASGAVVDTVASQQQGSGFVHASKLRTCAVFVLVSTFSVGFIWVLKFPKT